MTERLMGVAMVRGGLRVYMERGSHDELYRSHGLVFDHTQDVKGFWSDQREFLTRYEAAEVGYASGQCVYEHRELFSGDVDWDRSKKPKEKRWPTRKKLF